MFNYKNNYLCYKDEKWFVGHVRKGPQIIFCPCNTLFGNFLHFF